MALGGCMGAYNMARQAATAYYRVKANHAAAVEAHREAYRRLHVALAEEEQRIVNEIAAQLEHSDAPISERTCPTCGKSFVLIRVQKVELDACRECGGFWFDVGEFKTLTHALRDLADPADARAASPHKCPVCAAQMVRSPFLPGRDLMVDHCRAGHGFFLEHNELRRALDLTYQA